MTNVAEHLISRLEGVVKHVYTIPGDYIIHFLHKLSESKKIELINTTDEAHAGFAADGYARAVGMGCVCATFNVGVLKLFNPIACAYAERSPVIVIGGAPGIGERGGMYFDCQREMFKQITCAQAFLDNPSTAGYEIDRAFEALKHYKRPIYIELPRDVSLMSINYDVYTLGTPKSPVSDNDNLEDAIREVSKYIESSNNPVILAGVEIARYRLGKELTKFAERHNIPIAVTLLSKSTINELHPLYIGVYAGYNSTDVQKVVENSDCLLVCGEVLTEATIGYRPSRVFKKRDMVTCTIHDLKIRNHNYPNVLFGDFCKALFDIELTPKVEPFITKKPEICKFVPKKTKLTVARLFEKIDSILDEDTVVIADVGDSLFGASDLTVHHGNFYGPAFYLSMGFAIPASLGIKLAKPSVRPIVIVGDGSFQMSCSEISTIIKHKLDPIIFLLNNKGYMTERMIIDGKFNNIIDWDYHKFASLMGGKEGFKVTNEEELEAATTKALQTDGLTLINCIVDDISPALKRFTESLTKKVKKGV